MLLLVLLGPIDVGAQSLNSQISLSPNKSFYLSGSKFKANFMFVNNSANAIVDYGLKISYDPAKLKLNGQDNLTVFFQRNNDADGRISLLIDDAGEVFDALETGQVKNFVFSFTAKAKANSTCIDMQLIHLEGKSQIAEDNVKKCITVREQIPSTDL